MPHTSPCGVGVVLLAQEALILHLLAHKATRDADLLAAHHHLHEAQMHNGVFRSAAGADQAESESAVGSSHFAAPASAVAVAGGTAAAVLLLFSLLQAPALLQQDQQQP